MKESNILKTLSKIWIIFIILLGILSNLTIIGAQNNEEIYQEKLLQLKPDDMDGHYQLGLWCLKNKLVEEARTEFNKVLESNQDHNGARKNLGHFKYKDKWMTPDEMKAQGLVEYKGKWIPYDEAMKAKGMVLFENQWVTPGEKKRIEDCAKKIGVLAKRFTPQGVLDKPGADNENLSWKDARITKTDHFIVKTNLSTDALKDICFQMECAYLIWHDFFAFTESKGKFNIWVLKNRTEFEDIYNGWVGKPPLPQSKGSFVSKKRSIPVLLTYYDPYTQDITTSSLLLHEGTHYAVRLIHPACAPVWLNEGLATYFESGKFENNKPVTNLINQLRLPGIQFAISNNTYLKLESFINLTDPEYCRNSSLYYPQGWSLMYFLINGRQGKYKAGLKAYIEAWRKNKIVVQSTTEIMDKPAHLKLFEDCMGVSIGQLEKEWKDYILTLK